MLFAWLFILFVSSFQFINVKDTHIYIFIILPTGMEKYDRAKNKDKRFINPTRSQLIETIGTLLLLPLLRTLDVQSHPPIKQEVLTLEIKYLY